MFTVNVYVNSEFFAVKAVWSFQRFSTIPCYTHIIISRTFVSVPRVNTKFILQTKSPQTSE